MSFLREGKFMYIKIFKPAHHYKGKVPNGYKYVQVFEGNSHMGIKGLYNYLNIFAPTLFRAESFIDGDVILVKDKFYQLKTSLHPLKIRLQNIQVEEKEIYLDTSLIRFIVKMPYQTPFVAYYDKKRKSGKDSSLTKKINNNLFSIEYNSKEQVLKNEVMNEYSAFSDLYIFQIDEKGNKVSMSNTNVDFLVSTYKEEKICAS